jgi:hypothetical protein
MVWVECHTWATWDYLPPSFPNFFQLLVIYSSHMAPFESTSITYQVIWSVDGIGFVNFHHARAITIWNYATLQLFPTYLIFLTNKRSNWLFGHHYRISTSLLGKIPGRSLPLIFCIQCVRDLFIGGVIYLAKKIIMDGILHVKAWKYYMWWYFTCKHVSLF